MNRDRSSRNSARTLAGPVADSAREFERLLLVIERFFFFFE